MNTFALLLYIVRAIQGTFGLLHRSILGQVSFVEIEVRLKLGRVSSLKTGVEAFEAIEAVGRACHRSNCRWI